MGPYDAVALAAVCWTLVKIIQAASRVIASRRQAPAAADAATLAEVDELKTRLAEVEERLDFAERLLARAESADQLPGRVER
jgi:hypothetical protein